MGMPQRGTQPEGRTSAGSKTKKGQEKPEKLSHGLESRGKGHFSKVGHSLKWPKKNTKSDLGNSNRGMSRRSEDSSTKARAETKGGGIFYGREGKGSRGVEKGGGGGGVLS